MRIFYPIEKHSNSVKITGEKAHYLATVLRCKAGDDIVIFDGKGASYRALIKSITRKEVFATIDVALKEDTESPLHIILVQGLLKGEKMDLVIQKTTELGVKEILPVITARSQVRATKKTTRWRKIAEDAARQCGRSVIPAVHEPLELDGFLTGTGTIEGLIFWEEKGLPLKDACRKLSSADRPIIDSHLYLLIGPEGGFTKEEVQAAESKGLLVASLGTRILRTETAAIAAASIVQFLLGDLG